MAVLLAAGCGVLAAGGRAQDHIIRTAAQRFMLSYSGVFALIALTAAVAAGLVATDNIVMAPAGRVVSQAVNRALSLAAVGFLVTHVMLEILAHRSRAIDAVVPFLASGIHVGAYLGWPLAIVHGLLGGRPAKPYVDWSYGACLAAVALALVIRLVSATRSRGETAPYPVLDRAGFASLPDIPATAVTAGQQSTWPPVPPLPPHRALPRTGHHGGTRYNGPHHGSQHQASKHYRSQHHGSQHGSFRRQVEPR